MVKVCVNGFGSIGKRVSDAVNLHEKMELVGVSKYTQDEFVKFADLSKIKVFSSSSNFPESEGTVDKMINESDIIVDASPKKIGAINKELYMKSGKPAIFQGGEKSDISDVSFNSRSNFNDAQGKKYLRVVSCNTTAYCRVLKPISENYKIESVDAFLVRRGSDPHDKKGSPVNSVSWEPNSHHADDVNTIINLPMKSTAFKIPHTLSHVNSALIRFSGEAPSKDDIRKLFRKESRVAVLENATSTSQIVEIARDLGLKRYDTFVASLLLNTFNSTKSEIFISFVVPQESIVVPENLDAIAAQTGIMKKEESIEYTNKILGIDKIKSSLEQIFS
jgi:glyceraldehyde-3-phosphate dehydrogenase (NAD(P))